MKRYIIILIFVLCLVTGCGAGSTPAPDLVATQVAIEEAVRATMTARAPTPTSVPAATAIPPQLWKTANWYGVSHEYPSTCDVSENTAVQRFMDSGKWSMSATGQRRVIKDSWGFPTGPGAGQAGLLAQKMADSMDMSLTADFVLIYDGGVVDHPGFVTGWNTRYRENNARGAIEVLVLKSDTHEWFFCFIEYGSEYRQWTVRVKESITLESD